jgi:hypothetical protein
MQLARRFLPLDFSNNSANVLMLYEAVPYRKLVALAAY